MTLLQTTAAHALAEANFSANLAAISIAQPSLLPWLMDQLIAVEWIFGRDESLTAHHESGEWLAGCSLPRRAADAILKSLDARSAVVCFLAPQHGAQISAALDKLRPEQAIVAIVPGFAQLAIFLHCESFARAIADHRLWFAAGPAWEVELAKLFDEQMGLATPGSFVRLPDAEENTIQSMIAAAQTIFADANRSRGAKLREIKFVSQKKEKPRVLVVAPSRFRLWNDPAPAMLAAWNDIADVVHFDSDDPSRSAMLALVQSAAKCDAVFTTNTGRADLPGLLPESFPWITWATSTRIPSGSLAGTNDRLIVVDPQLREIARRQGWINDRIHIATFPRNLCPAPIDRNSISIIADTRGLETPDDLSDFSSHALLWEAIREEILRSPHVLRDVEAYLTDRVGQLGVTSEGFPRARFIEELILPAYQQGIARVAIAQKLPLKIYGRGWQDISEFADFSRGAITSREQFDRAIDSSAQLLHVWPAKIAHPSEFVGRPIVGIDSQRKSSQDVSLSPEVLKNALRGVLF